MSCDKDQLDILESDGGIRIKPHRRFQPLVDSDNEEEYDFEDPFNSSISDNMSESCEQPSRSTTTAGKI